MYKYYEDIRKLAERITGLGEFDNPGEIKNSEMREEWIPGKGRIWFEGITGEGTNFELTLEVSKCQESE